MVGFCFGSVEAEGFPAAFEDSTEPFCGLPEPEGLEASGRISLLLAPVLALLLLSLLLLLLVLPRESVVCVKPLRRAMVPDACVCIRV